MSKKDACPFSVHVIAGGPYYGWGFVWEIISDGDITFFDPKTPSSVPDVPGPPTSTEFVRQSLPSALSQELNDKGAIISQDGSQWWNGETLASTGLPAPTLSATYFWSLTNENRLVGELNNGDPTKGFLWENGNYQLFSQLLASQPLLGPAYASQFSNIVPLLASNENATDHSYNIVTSAVVSGTPKLVLWKNVQPPPLADGTQPPRQWQLYEMRFPANVQWQNLQVINSSGVIAAIGNAGTGDNHALLLVPVTLTNLADPYRGTPNNPGHNSLDTPVSFKQNDKDTNIKCAAWIAAHDPSNNNAPRMPQLRAEAPGLAGCCVFWKLQVIFHDRHGNPHRDFDTGDPNDSSGSSTITSDSVFIPTNGSTAPNTENSWHKITDGSPWSICDDLDWQTEVGNGFFGGDAVLSLKVTTADESTVLSPQTDFKFRIAGENPDEILCKQYICGEYGGPAVPTRTPPDNTWHGFWFAYAVAREETAYEGGNRHYNNFFDNGSHSRSTPNPGHEGVPNWHDDGTTKDRTTGTGGYGIFQHTYEDSDAYYYMPRNWIWNWQANVDNYTYKFNYKYQAGLKTYNGLRATYQSKGYPDIGNEGNFSGLESLVLTYINGGGGQTTYLNLTNAGRRLTCWYPRGTTWNFLPNGENYVKKVNAEVGQ